MKNMPLRSPWLAALLLAVAAQTLFSIGLGRVDHMVFDETHYVPAARHILALDAPSNVEHPLVGKTLIAAGIALFGDTPIGWRIPATLAGTMLVVGTFTLAFTLLRSVATATAAAVFAMLNGMIYVQARIAMIDAFLSAFIVWGLALAAMAVRSERPMPRAIGAGMCLGLATGCKWMAAPFVAAVCLGFLWVRRRDRLMGGGAFERRHMGGVSAWTLALALGSVSVATYFATFWPAFLYRADPLHGVVDLLALQRRMYTLQTQVLAPHVYQSGWLSWAFDVRPVWYLFETAGGVQRGIIMLANPVTTVLGLAGVCVCTVRWWRTNDVRPAIAVLLWAFAWGVFALIPKSLGFAYYYVPASALLAVATAAALHRDDERRTWMLGAAAAVALASFATFHPIYSAEDLPMGEYERLMWLESWR